MSSLIEVEALSRRFGEISAVSDVSFSVESGEVLGFLGPNGAGKSTTMKIIVGFLAPTSGTVRVAGADVRSDSLEVRRHIGYLSEGGPLYGDMTPEAFLDFVARARGLGRKERRRAVDDVIGLLDLGDVLRRRIETLSKGFRRRVGVAQALLHDPDVLIMDEPTDGLDPNQKREVRRLIRSMRGRKSIIISTHLLEEVDAVCDRAIIINRGRIVADSTPAELFLRAPGQGTIKVAVPSADAERARAILAGMPEVALAETGETNAGRVELTVILNENHVMSDVVGRRLRDGGVVDPHVRPAVPRLDDVFRDLTAERT